MALTKIDDRGLITPIDLLDDEKIRFGTSNDLAIYHENNKNLIKSISTTNTEIWSDTFFVKDTDGVAVFKGSKDGACELYYDGHAAFRTENVGAVLTDNSTSVTLRFETTQGQAGNITGIDNDNLIIQDNLGKDWLNMHKDGQVEIYHNGTKKFETTAAGATLSGELSATGANFTDDGQSSPIVSIMADDGSPWGLHLGNSTFGDNLGLHAYCNNTGHVYIDNIGSGSTFPNWDMRLSHASAAHSMISFTGSDTSVKLYYGGYEKLRTATYGTIVTGDANTVQEYFKTNDGVVRGYIYADSNNHIYILDGQAHKVLKGEKDGSTFLYYDNAEKFKTESGGVVVTDSNTSVHLRLVTSDGDAGYLYGSSNNQVGLLDREGHWMVRGTKDGSAELMYDNSTRFQTLTDGTLVTGRAQVQCGTDSVCQINQTTNSSGAYHQESMGVSGGVIAYVGHSNQLCNNPTAGNYAIRFEGSGLEFANSSNIQARITNHGGIAFGGDTAANNTLGDYEEGQWTPTINYGVVTSGSNALTYSIQQGWYVKIGAFVQASFYIAFGAQGDGNDFTMGGLPFASVNKPYNNLSYSSSGSLGYKDCNFTNNADQKLYIGNNAANIYFYNNNSGTHSPASTKYVSTSNVSSALYGSVSYRAN